eukprot:evm.model.scf_408.2 EVM.evm.TU.scf_408.2   scf_408:16942-20304(-)
MEGNLPVGGGGEVAPRILLYQGSGAASSDFVGVAGEKSDGGERFNGQSSADTGEAGDAPVHGEDISSRDRRSPTEASRGRAAEPRARAAKRQRDADGAEVAVLDPDELRRQRNSKAQKRFRERQKRMIADLEARLMQLEEKAHDLEIKNAALERENEILWAHMEHCGGPTPPQRRR